MLASKFVAKKIISTSTRNLLASTAIGCALALPSLAYAQNLPTGGSVAAGSVAISQPNATHLNITQSSQSAVVNWQGFSVGQGSAVNFAQPNASSAILNRVTGGTPSTIAGSITANGQVYLVNPNGIAITKSGSVNAGGGFVASTLGISDGDFMSGKRSFSGNGASARVSNAGVITVGRGGYAALIGGTVSNSGSISVPLGKVALGSGERATLDFSGDGFLQVAMPTNAGGKGALIRNSGSIKADGGSVIISAATAREAARSAINISGLVQARSISGHNGSIMIGGAAGGRVKITGRLIANSRHYAGGNITVTGKDIALKSATVDASGATGGGNINIGGGRQGSGSLQHADTTTIDATTTIKADATQSGNGGNVVVWSDLLTNFAGTVSAKGGALSGNGGEAEVSSHGVLGYTGFANLTAPHGATGTLLLDPYDIVISNAANANGSFDGATPTSTFTPSGTSVISVGTLQSQLGGANVTITTGGTGSAGTDAGNITVADTVTWSSGYLLTLTAAGAIAVNAPISITGGGQLALNYSTNLSFGAGGGATFASGQTGQALTINGTGYTLVYSMAQLDAIDGREAVGGTNVTTYGPGLAGAYALAGNLDAAGTSYTDSVVRTFSGTLEGLGHTVSNLTISSSNNNVGLVGFLTGTVRDIGVVNPNVFGFLSNTGALVGDSQTGGTVTQSYATGGTVSGVANVGGLVGRQSGGSITKSYAAVNVSGQSTDVGGLVGSALGATVAQSYASGTVSGSGVTGLGGLVGFASGGTVTQSYATGFVNGSGASNVGGLIGTNSSGNTVSLSYATGAVLNGGGIVGSNIGTLSNIYWDTDTHTTGQSGVATGSATGATGLTTRQLQGLDPISGSTYFSTATNLGNGTISAFSGGANGLYPYLTSFFPGGVQAVSGKAYKDAAGTIAAAPNSAGSVTVVLDSGSRIGQATTGANGYYYIAVANGTLKSGASLLATVPFNSGRSANAATLVTSTGGVAQTGVDLYGNTLTATTSETTLSQAKLSFASVSTSDSTATGIVNTLSGYNLTATGASFKIDRAVTTGGIFSVMTQTGSPLTVAAPIEIDGSGSLGLLSGGALAINAPITVTGAGSVNLAAANDTTTVVGMPLLELSFAQGASLQFTGTPHSGQALTINGAAYTLIYTAADLGAVNINLSGNYALAKPLDLGTTTYTDAVIAGSTAATGFLGKFDGLGNTISNLTIDASSSYNVGLFGIVGDDVNNNSAGTVENIGLIGGSVTSTLAGAGPGAGPAVGALAGTNTGTILNAYATTSVNSPSIGAAAGGLVGYNWGVVANVYASGSVTDRTTGSWVGGLVGYNNGYPAGVGVGSIINAYATGAVSGGSGSGGLGNGSGIGSDTGGLAGINIGTISNAYATGVVSGGSGTYLGGLVGENDTLDGPATVNHGYWDTATTGISSVNQGAGTGLTTRQLQGLDPITGNPHFSTATNLGNGTTSAFSGGANGLYPYLTSFFPNGVQAITGTAKTAGVGISGGQVGIYSGGTLLTGGTTATGANGYFYEIVAAGTLASSNVKIGETLTPAGASSVSALSYTDAAAASGSVFALGTLNNGLNRQTTAETTYGALQTDLGGTFGTSKLATLNAALASTPTSTTATGAGFTLDQAVNAGADFSVTTTAANAPITLSANLNASGYTVTLNSSGAISQSGGAITAGTLTGSSKGTVSLNQAGNAIGALGAFTASTGDFSLTDNVTNLAVSGVITVTAGNLSLTNSGGEIALNSGVITTGGSQTFTTAVTLGADTTLSGSTIFFDSTLDGAHALTVTGNALFGGTVGATTKLTSLSVSGTSALNGGGVTTTGSQTYGGAATLGADATLSGSTIFFDSTLDGAHALTVTGNAMFDGTVGATTKLTSLSVSGTSALDGGGITTTGTQTYSGATTLGADTTLKSSSAVTFGSTLDGAHSLTVNAAGTTSFNGAVGFGAALTSLTTDAAGTTQLNGGAVRTTGAQSYGDPVTLRTATTLTGSLVSFGGTVNGAYGLTVTGNAAFGGAVGATTALASLSVSGTSALNGGGVTTTGLQSYTGTATLGADTTLNAGGLLTFDAAVTGSNFALSVEGTGLEIDGSIGTVASFTGTASNGNVTIGASGGISSSGAIQIFANGNFINNAGAAALTVPAGTYYTIYTQNAANPTGTLPVDNFGTLSGANYYNDAYNFKGGTFASAVPTGNHFVYGYAASLTPTLGGSATKTYDGNATAPTASLTVGATLLSASDSASFAFSSASYADANAATAKNVTATGITLTSNPNNYTLQASSATAAVGTIDALAVTLTGSRSYDGGTDAAAGILTVSNVVGTDNIGLGGAGSVGSANASATAQALNLTGLSLSNTNYTLIGGSGTVTINPLAVTLTGSRSYNGGTDVAAGILTASNKIGTDNIGLTGAGSVASPNAGATAQALNFTGLSLSNTNYTLTGGSGTVTINPLAVTLTGSRSYNGGTDVAAGILTASNKIGTDNIGLTGAGSVASANVSAGAQALNLAGLSLSNTNYTLSGGSGTVTVTPASITVSALGGTSVYGSSPSDPGLSASGLQNGESVGVLNGLSNSFGISGTTGVAGSPYTLSVLGTLGNQNYTITTRNSGIWTVTPAAITVTALGGTSVYGSSPSDPGLSASGLQNGESVGVLKGLSNSFGITSTSGVAGGPYTLSVLGTLGNQNYTITTRNTGIWTVTPASVAVTALGGTSVYGSSPSDPGLSATGLQNGESVGVLTGLSNSFGVTSTSGVAGGPYTLSVLGTLNNQNYTITTRNTGIWTVTPASVAVTALGGTSVYGSSPSDPGLSASGLQNGESVGVLTGLSNSFGITSTSGVAGSPYALTVAGTLSNQNYTITARNGGVWTVTPAAITVTALGGTSVYGSSPSDPGLSASGLQNGESVGVLTGLSNSFGITGTTGVAGSPYTLSVLGTLGNQNYTITARNSGVWTVTPAAITVTALGGTSVYGSSPANPGLSATGLQNGESVGVLTGLSNSFGITGTTGVVGSPYTLNVAGKLGNQNYAVTALNSGVWIVTPRPLTVTADAQSRGFGDPNPTLTYLIGGLGLVNGDTLSGALDTAATSQSVVGSYAITQATLAASRNYALTYFGANLTVTPAAKGPVNPVVVAGSAYQTPKTTSINFVTTQGTPGPLTAFTRTASNTNTNANTKTAANPDDLITGAVGKAVVPSADGLTYKPISQYDAAQYTAATLPDHVDQAGFATILTMIARAATHDIPPMIDQLFDPAKGADWHGVGWQNPLVDKVKFSTTPQGSEPNGDTALALDGTADLGALLGKGPVILAGKDGKSWLLAVAITEAGIVANDPVTGQRVLLGYDAAKKTVGPISRMFDPAANKWIALNDAATAGIGFVDAAKVEALKTFAADKYLTVTVVK